MYRLRKALCTSSDEHLSGRVLKAGLWLLALRISDRIFRIIRLLILARLLFPEAFGLFGMAFLSVELLRPFSLDGFQQALVQKTKPINAYLNTAWTLQALHCLFLAVLVFFLAPFVTCFFDEPLVTPLLRVASLNLILLGFRNIGIIYFKKELAFHKHFFLMFTGTVVEMVVSILAAFLLRNAWAMLYGLLAGNLVRLIFSFVIHPYRPKPCLDTAKAADLYRFGFWVWGSLLLVFLATKGDDVFVGKILGVTALGLYQLAFRLSHLILEDVTNIVTQVAFPTYSMIRQDVSRLKTGYLQSAGLTLSITLPLTITMILLGPEFVRQLFGEKWIGMTGALQILAVSSLLQTVVISGRPLFWSLGKPRLDFRMNLVRVVAISVAIYPLTDRYGIHGTAVTVLLSAISTFPLWWMTIKTELAIQISEVLKQLLPVFIATCVLCFGLIITGHVFNRPDIIGLFFMVLLSGALYIAVHFLLWQVFRCGPIEGILELRTAHPANRRKKNETVE